MIKINAVGVHEPTPGSNAKTAKAYLDLWEHTQKITRRLSDSEYERFKSEPYDIGWRLKDEH